MIRRAALAATVVVQVLCMAGFAAAAGEQAASASATQFVRPVIGATLTLGFGCTNLPFEPRDSSCPGGHWHSGVDLAAPRGTAVVASHDGAVQVVVSSSGFGLHVIVDRGDGLTSLYGHLDRVTVTGGATVVAGDVIGTVGSTGNSTGPHLHFEIRRDSIPEDPQADLALP